MERIESISKPLISIVIPVYKVGRYIENSIKSVCSQQCRDFEVILVDNNSPDDSIEIAENLLKDTDINYTIVKQPKQGLPAARNLGIEQANGTWIVSIDPDDTISHLFLSELYKTACNFDTNIVFSKYDEVTEGHQFEFPQEELEGCAEPYKKDEILMHLLTRRIPLMVSNMFIKKSVFVDNNLKFDEDVILGADLILMWEILMTQDKIVYLNKFLYNWFERPDSLSTAPSKVKLDSNHQGYKRMLERLRKQYDQQFVKWIDARQNFGVCNLLAQHADYNYYIASKKQYYSKEIYETLKSFPDGKIRVLNRMVYYAPWLFYFIIHHVLKRYKGLWKLVDHKIRK